MTLKQALISLLLFVPNISFGIVGDYIQEDIPNFICLLEVDMIKGDSSANFVCSSTLIDSNTLLTAGHCNYKEFFGEDATDQISFRVKCPGHKEHRIMQNNVNENFDLMTINLNSSLSLLSFPKLIKNHKQEVEIAQKGKCSIWGYGLDNDGEFRNLRGVRTNLKISKRTEYRKRGPRRKLTRKYLLSQKQKENRIGARLFDQEFERETKGNYTITLNEDHDNQTMPGDSGGPLLCRYQDEWYLLGVNSFGNDFVDIVQSLTHQLQWVEDNNMSDDEVTTCN